MTVCWKKLSQIDKRTKYGVYGWIREAEAALELGHIPLMISSICILYFYEDEMFDEIADAVKMSKDRKCVTKLPESSWQNTNYGIVQIASNSVAIYRWKMKQSFNKERVKGVMIGITNTTNPNHHFYTQKDKISYAHCNDSKYIKQGWSGYKTTPDPDTYITMELDLQKAELRFLKDNATEPIIIRNIQTGDDLQYRMFVSMYVTGDSVEIINFTKQYL